MARKGIEIDVIGVNKVLMSMTAREIALKLATQLSIVQGVEIVKQEIEASIRGERAELRSVDTSRFLKSIDIDIKTFSAIVTSDAPYAEFLEFGTRRRKPRPHFANSIARTKKKVMILFQKKVSSAIK